MTETSVVICAHTLERWDELNRAVGSVRTQTRAPREIVVVMDNNEALRERAARENAGVTVCRAGA
jgi:glucosyl-dolichyl phosphate glucuronosyltransferase